MGRAIRPAQDRKKGTSLIVGDSAPARKKADAAKPLVLCPWPVRRPANWTALVNQAIDKTALEQLRTSVNRGRPWGSETWIQQTARRLGLLFTLRNPGRPPKPKTNQ